MGRKSRLKRERRAQAELLKRLTANRQQMYKEAEESFQQSCKALTSLFTEYSAIDVVLALNISDLWLPNISCQARHQLALTIAISIDPVQFAEIKTLDTYGDFSNFIGSVYKLLPSFPSLEDYVPEPDWGEVRIKVNDKYLSIFYGGSVERIPDFIESFRMLRVDQNDALRDMDVAIMLQDWMISNIDPSIVGSAIGISPGHLEVPCEQFWTAFLEIVNPVCKEVPLGCSNLTNNLILKQGDKICPDSMDSFGNAVLEGILLPAVLVNINEILLPVSMRSVTGVVIDYWAARDKKQETNDQNSLINQVAKFLLNRFGENSVITGPLYLVSHTKKVSSRIASVLRTGENFYLLVMMAPEQLASLVEFDRQVNEITSEKEDWGFLPETGSDAFQFRRSDGSLPNTSEIKYLVVLSNVTTSFMRLEIPKVEAQILSMPDFITIFDSLKDIDEFNKFCEYEAKYGSMMMPMTGTADRFASFRDSFALLVDGAVEPSMVTLDPHWGSNWRYKELKEFWGNSPSQFPDGQVTWKLDAEDSGPLRLIAKGFPTLAWSTSCGISTVQTVLEVNAQNLDLHSGELLELFIHCLIDAFEQCSELIKTLDIFENHHIVIYCRGNEATLVKTQEDKSIEQDSTLPLLSGWKNYGVNDSSSLVVSVNVNLARAQIGFQSAHDGTFEAECLVAALEGLTQFLGKNFDSSVKSALFETTSRKPRFVLNLIERPIDVPDYAKPNEPQHEQYKLARQGLAILLKKQGAVAPGKYELKSAKKIIDLARDAMRQKVHDIISKYDRTSLLLYCIEQYDASITEYDRKINRIKLSLNHEVSYNRSKALAEAHDRFINLARNYRYLLECCLSAQEYGDVAVNEDEMLRLVASIDWLFVLYGASDVLHNGIDVAGIELDGSYIPKVYYSDENEEKQRLFALEHAQNTLGIDLIQEDEVNFSENSVSKLGPPDSEFKSDVGFTFTHLIQVLTILAYWQRVGGDTELRLCYQASADIVTAKLIETVEELSECDAYNLIDFLSLDPGSIRRLLGKSEYEADVPVWEHTKRGSRYAIKPIIKLENKMLAWGAAAAHRALTVWNNSIVNGYLPANFNWPQIKSFVRKIKKSLETQLEVQAYEVCLRSTEYTIQGIDFKYRFPKEQFDDVGDFDVLAYWPGANRWLMVECKYNQPPFCLKDARRLRERIFGTDKDKGHFEKIEKRREFLEENYEQIRKLLGWPCQTINEQHTIIEAYVSRDIYWWMRNPPYEVSTEFIRIDAFDSWLRNYLIAN